MIRIRNAAKSASRTRLHGLIGSTFLVFALLSTAAQTINENAPPPDPLPQDSGIAGLQEMLVRLHTTARMLHTTAHPDDEDGGMITLESRGKGVTTVLLTLNR